MKWIIIALLAGCGVSETLNAQSQQKFVLLPRGQARRVSHLCSRGGPSNIDASWTPSQSDIAKLEANLTSISKLRSKEGHIGDIAGRQVEGPERYFRQYVGIVVKGRKLIYINAICHLPASDEWQTQLMIGCDGGSCFWGAEYDPESGQFSDLHINGSM